MFNTPTRPAGRFCFAICLLVFTVLSFSAEAQRRSPRGINAEGDMVGGGGGSSRGGGSSGNNSEGWAVALNAGYDNIASGDLKYTYKGAPTFGFTVIRNQGWYSLSLTADYRAYKPKKDTIVYGQDGAGDIAATFSNFKAIAIYAGAVANLQISDQFKVYGGANLGYLLYNYKQSFFAATDGFDYEESNSSAYFGPKVGFNLNLGGAFGIGLEGKYTFIFPRETNISSREGTTDTGGPKFRTLSGNLSLTYNF